MGTLLYLATAEAGFGLNLNILETNLLNLAIVLGLLVVFGRRLLSNILSERRAKIEGTIAEAEAKASQAAASLAEAQQNLAQAQAQARTIREQAIVTAEQAKSDVLAKGHQEVERLKSSAAADLTAEQERAIAELRQRVTVLALAQVETRLQDRLGDDVMQEQLLNRTIGQIGG
ncbi:MAG: F0F1 ATP synthase subunit B [Spirulinaceae cyanobacterium]